MKKIISAVAIVLLTVSVVYAVPEDNCGCGIGTMVFEGQDGLFSQICAVTTNGTFGNQTFGISTGTLGCDKPANFAQNEQVNKFVAENMDNLAVDIAVGSGESLETLADLIQIPAERREKLYAALQDNFERIYPTAEVTHEFVIGQIATIVEQI